ncbi:monovalent cation/H+ antiporter subunit D [Roseibaca sp. Y0-43]|uniref:monovalent cation/H+ antiporter subunit D n=1 Tax=Roseibaca sp. Y0-43 TaxID=2816854 RepID=UPI001D0CCD75|nr:monovalent cation/H+ antiporter subunit D [Roseibaca sp. Y0-43]MCC1481951.1 monovalent cation/H+ antiporter subunit D [Roseibaca sp. Y0-43]
MTHFMVLPLIITAVMAPTLLLVRGQLVIQRTLSVATTALLVVICAMLMAQAATGEVTVYKMGNWDAPFGIVMVMDRLSALMITLTALLALGVLIYSIGTKWDERGAHFHPLYQFQLFGLFGAMMTGDIFNLFVFFEVLLIASYGLMVHGGGRLRTRAGVQYIIYNLAGSTLFVFSLATIYAVFGTLNMADMAAKAATLPPEDAALVRTAGAMVLLVFAVKGALLPLHFWLPNTYTHAPAPVAALFAIMTKVGAYAILRVFTLIFGPSLALTGTLFSDLLMPAALITTVIGMVGVMAGGSLARVASFAAVGSMGTLFIAIAPFTEGATVAALYYLIHSTLAAGALFLVIDMVQARRGTCALDLRAPIAQSGLVAALFFAAAIATTGLPPLSGFIGKLFVLDALRDHALAVWVWGVVLVTSLVAVVGFSQAGSIVFWKAHAVKADSTPAAPATGVALAGVGGLLALIVLMTIVAGPLTDYLTDTAAQLYAPEGYIGAVLGAEE